VRYQARSEPTDIEHKQSPVSALSQPDCSFWIGARDRSAGSLRRQYYLGAKAHDGDKCDVDPNPGPSLCITRPKKSSATTLKKTNVRTTSLFLIVFHVICIASHARQPRSPFRLGDLSVYRTVLTRTFGLVASRMLRCAHDFMARITYSEGGALEPAKPVNHTCLRRRSKFNRGRDRVTDLAFTSG
jgi:hypothetical protein